MIRTHRSSTTAIVIACLLGTSSEILFAADDASSSRTETTSLSADSITPATEDVSTIPATVMSGGKQLPGTNEFLRSLVASPPHLLRDDTLSARSLALATDESRAFAQRGYRGRGSRGRNNGAAAALFVGTAAAIAGTALLIYANRPECSTIPTASGCGYGTKVVGGSVLSAGIAGLVVGALTWR